MKLKLIRIKKGWSQARLSQESGVPQSLISYIESGKTSSTIITLKKIATALGITISELLDEETDFDKFVKLCSNGTEH